MEYTFFITTPSSVVYQVYPLNWLECSLVDEKEKDQIFYRRKFEGKLTFGGKKLCHDFNIFEAIHAMDPCAQVNLLILQDLNIYYEAYFSTSMGEWDLDNQTFTVQPLPTDDYTIWAENGEFEHNMLDVPTAVTVLCNSNSYTRNRWLWDVVEYLAEQVFGASVTCTSRFFSETTNYVTHQSSRVNHLTIAQKSDIKRHLSSNPATQGMISFNEMMEILRIMFNVYWRYNATTDTLTIEHLSLFDAEQVAGIDLRTQEIASRSNRYRYLREKMPKHELWYPMEGKNTEFTFGECKYDDLCVNQDPETNKVELRVRVTTDIEYIQEIVLSGDSSGISDEGFVILGNYEQGGSYYTYQAPGLYNTVSYFNVYMGWPYLLEYYHRHGRVLLDGYFYIAPKTFLSAQKRKVQEINAIVCHAAGYTPEQYITTELGETHFGGEKGFVEKAVIKPYGEVNFTLLYGPIDSDEQEQPVNPKSLRVVRDGLDIFSYLSEPNIYDTYYSVWTNSDTCDVIMIPAGTMYQQDLLTQINPIATVSYNFTHASLSGWLLSVDGSTSYTTHTDVECSTGAPAPPDVPEVPVISGHNQYSTCGPIRIIWNSVEDATYYTLQRNPSLGGLNEWETQISTSSLNYDDYDAGVNEGSTYRYRLAAGNISGMSAWSAEHTVDDIMC